MNKSTLKISSPKAARRHRRGAFYIDNSNPKSKTEKEKPTMPKSINEQIENAKAQSPPVMGVMHLRKS